MNKATDFLGRAGASELEQMSLSMRPCVTRAAGFMSNVIAAALLALTFSVLIAPHFGFLFLTIISDSMGPALPAGSVAMVRPAAVSEIKVGDIIAYQPGEAPSPTVTHRVVQIINQEGSPSFVTAGDRNEDPDKYPVPSTGVIGKVLFHIPLLGFLFNFVKQPIGFGLLVGLPAVVIVIRESRIIAAQIGSLKNKSWQESK